MINLTKCIRCQNDQDLELSHEAQKLLLIFSIIQLPIRSFWSKLQSMSIKLNRWSYTLVHFTVCIKVKILLDEIRDFKLSLWSTVSTFQMSFMRMNISNEHISLNVTNSCLVQMRVIFFYSYHYSQTGITIYTRRYTWNSVNYLTLENIHNRGERFPVNNFGIML